MSGEGVRAGRELLGSCSLSGCRRVSCSGGLGVRAGPGRQLRPAVCTQVTIARSIRQRCHSGEMKNPEK